MTLYEIFKNCLNAKYTTLKDCVDVAILKTGLFLQIYFEASTSAVDWQNNLDFPAVPYRHMNDTVWYAHRGFVRVWKTAESYVGDVINDRGTQKILIAGYSHGAALALLCHEYVWFNRPDLRGRLTGYGFGCPRVVWGIPSRTLKSRWEHFTVVRNIDDLVTHLPPKMLGYTHVGKMLEIGECGKYSPTDAHRPENILRELKNRG